MANSKNGSDGKGKKGKNSPSKKKPYNVGYGKPPKAHQFKPGQSGNPRGRPKKSKNLKTILQSELFSTVSLRMEGKETNVPMLQAIVMACTRRALNGNDRASAHVLDLYARYLDGDLIEDLPLHLTPEQDELIQGIAERLTRLQDLSKNEDKDKDDE